MTVPAMPEEIVVMHNAAESRFETRFLGERAVCDYRIEGGRMVLVFTHTYVPPGLRGRGIAEKLVRTALGYAQAHTRQVVPACSYVAAFIQRNREFQTLVA